MSAPVVLRSVPHLTFLEKCGLAVLAVAVVVFGVLVEYRSALMMRRMTDLDVYLRAAWAVRTGADLYAITDNNGWHYHYPPLLAILLTPLASPPADADPTGMPPFALSVAMWYVFNVLLLCVAVHRLANALEQVEGGGRRVEGKDKAFLSCLFPSPSSRRWWMLRVLPLLVCLPPIAHTLMRGQLNLLLLWLFCSMLTAQLRGRRLESGLWLAGAICVKIIPAFLLLYPLWRRDGRMLLGCGVGLVLGLGVVPGVVFGPERTVDYYQSLGQKVLLPGMTHDGDQARAQELTDITATASQSLIAILHNALHFDRATRPNHATLGLRCAALALGGLLTLITLLAAGWPRSRKAGNHSSGAETVLFLGALLMNMLLLSPVAHLHYFALLVPLVMGLLARLPAGQRIPWWWYVLGSANLMIGVLPHIPGWEVARDAGLVTLITLVFWLLAVVALWRGCGQETLVQRQSAIPNQAA